MNNNELITYADKSILLTSEENTSKDLYYYSNPLNIQANILETIRKRLNGEKIIVDPNNSFMFLTEMFSEVASGFALDIINKFNTLYPKRAITLNDLYQHISDFEYVGLFSTPASIMFELILDKNYLITNAVSYDEMYDLIQIPSDTIIFIEDIPFGIYYPIDIRINKITQNINVVYNTSKKNPLFDVSTISVEKHEYIVNNIELLSLKFPIFQFKKTIITEVADNNIGFYKKYFLDGRFYAIRIYTFLNNEWKELSYTLSDFIYDLNVPTAKINVFGENMNELHIEVPLVYFDKKLVGNMFKIEVYTTYGKINVNITDISNIKAKFDCNDENLAQYSNSLKYIPSQYIAMRPLVDKISGGNNNLDFNTIKDMVIYGNNLVPISRKDIDIHFKKYGVDYQPSIDSITDRIFYAMKYITDEANIPYNLLNGSLWVNMSEISDYPNVIIHDNQIVFTPDTIFKINKSTNQIVLATQEEVNTLETSDTSTLITLCNSDLKYLTYPYHLVINLNDKYPYAESYDLYDTNFCNNKFYAEHQSVPSTVDLITGIIFLNSKQNQYVIRLGLQRSDDLKQTQISNIVPVLATYSTENKQLLWIGVYNSSLSDDNIDVFDFYIDIPMLFDDNRFEVENYISNEFDELHLPQYLLLEGQKFYLSCFVNKSVVHNPTNTNDVIENFKPQTLGNDFVGITAYTFDAKFGKNLKDIINNNLTIEWTGQQYETYDYDVPAVYETDIYARDENGNIIYTIDEDNNVILQVEHNAGDPILDEEGNQIYKFKKGDIKLDVNGNPIPISPRKLNYIVEGFFLDYIYKVYSSIDSSINNTILTLIRNNFTAIENLRGSILENTKVYFRPYSTIGYTKAKTSESSQTYVYIPINLSFQMTVVVTREVISDEQLKSDLKNQIIDIIRQYISSTEVVAASVIEQQIHNQLGEYVVSITIDSINNLSLRTLYNTENDKRFTIKTILAYNPSLNQLELTEDITITWKTFK